MKIKTSDILREAKANLWDGKDTFDTFDTFDTSAPIRAICFAINQAFTNLSCDQPRKVRIVIADKTVSVKHKISVALIADTRRHGTVWSWLSIEAGVPDADLSDANIQEYRHRWLDQMIADYTAAGD